MNYENDAIRSYINAMLAGYSYTGIFSVNIIIHLYNIYRSQDDIGQNDKVVLSTTQQIVRLCELNAGW